jgi:glutathione S-transferase
MITSYATDFYPRYINLYREENLTEEYLKINPTGTIPALVDKLSDVKVWDSHAIGIYLVQKFARNDSLYPKDFLQRTLINERLFFEASFLSARLFEICVSIEAMKIFMNQSRTQPYFRTR